jgi:hypothetical protein
MAVHIIIKAETFGEGTTLAVTILVDSPTPDDPLVAVHLVLDDPMAAVHLVLDGLSVAAAEAMAAVHPVVHLHSRYPAT